MRRFPTPGLRPSASEPHGEKDEVRDIIVSLQQTDVRHLKPFIAEAQDRYTLIFLRLYFHHRDAHKDPIRMQPVLLREMTDWKARERGTAIVAFVRYLQELANRSRVRRADIEKDIRKLQESLNNLMNARNTTLIEAPASLSEVLPKGSSAQPYIQATAPAPSPATGKTGRAESGGTSGRDIEPAQPDNPDVEHDVSSEPDILTADTEFDALAQQINELATHVRMMKVGYAPRHELKRLRGVVDDAKYDRNHHKTEVADALIRIIDMFLSQLDYQGYHGEGGYGLGESAVSSGASFGHPGNERASTNQDRGVVKDGSAAAQPFVASDSGSTTQFVHLVQENMYNNLLTVLLEQCEIERIDVVPGMKFDGSIMRRGSRKLTQNPEDADRVASVESWGFRHVGEHPSIKRRAVVEVYELGPE